MNWGTIHAFSHTPFDMWPPWFWHVIIANDHNINTTSTQHPHSKHIIINMLCISFQHFSFLKHIIWEKFNHLFIHDHFIIIEKPLINWGTIHNQSHDIANPCIQSHDHCDMWHTMLLTCDTQCCWHVTIMMLTCDTQCCWHVTHNAFDMWHTMPLTCDHYAVDMWPHNIVTCDHTTLWHVTHNAFDMWHTHPCDMWPRQYLIHFFHIIPKKLIPFFLNTFSDSVPLSTITNKYVLYHLLWCIQCNHSQIHLLPCWFMFQDRLPHLLPDIPLRRWRHCS